jgi:predicted dehydrogenase
VARRRRCNYERIHASLHQLFGSRDGWDTKLVRDSPEVLWVGEQDDVDVAAVILKLSGGGLVILSGTRRDPLGYDVRLEVFGTGDSIVVGQDARSPIRSVEADAKPPRAAYRDFWDRFEPAYRSELAAFVETVLTGAPSPCPLEDARSALAIALAAEFSRAERRPVSIEEVELARAHPNS